MHIESYLPKFIRKVIHFPTSVTTRCSFLRQVPIVSWEIRKHYELVITKKVIDKNTSFI